jgi:hypothetical protein
MRKIGRDGGIWRLAGWSAYNVVSEELADEERCSCPDLEIRDRYAVGDQVCARIGREIGASCFLFLSDCIAVDEDEVLLEPHMQSWGGVRVSTFLV